MGKDFYYVVYFAPQIADAAIVNLEGDGKMDGEKTIRYLFSFGSACLEK